MTKNLSNVNKIIRSLILRSTTAAGSGHPTSSLSAVELMSSLFFNGFFKYDPANHNYSNNDRLIFSKGHAAPLFYSLWAAAGLISEEEILTLRKFDSRLEGHPTLRFPYTEVPTGSLGQGLSIGLGMALNAKYLDKLPYKTYVLLGDGEMAEGSNWESLQLASHYKLNNLIGIIDVSRLEQAGETLYLKDFEDHGAHDLERKISSFGWHTIIIDGHSQKEIEEAYRVANSNTNKPTMIIAVTTKGKGVSILAGKNNWHGKVLNNDQLKDALNELGEINHDEKGNISLPNEIKIIRNKTPEPSGNKSIPFSSFDRDKLVATREVYGNILNKLFSRHGNIVALDAGMSNSTFSDDFKNEHPESFFEMFIAEQNMVGVAIGLSKRENIPFVSTFASFITRSHDQLRMAAYADANIKVVCSHAGVSIGEDGVSQMGLEDIALFRSLHNCVVLYPSDAVSAEKLIVEITNHIGMSYIRMTRMKTPLLYTHDDQFKIGGSKTIKESNTDFITVVAAGITVHEALKAYNQLKKENIIIRIIDLYSVKPIDKKTLEKAAQETKAIITVEDHYREGGIGEAVETAIESIIVPIHSLSVNKLPRSGKPNELLAYEEINSDSIVALVKKLYTDLIIK